MKTISIGDLRKMIQEAATKNEFKPVFGKGVQEKNKEINGKAKQETNKRVKDYDGGVNKKKNNINNNPNDAWQNTENRGMSDLEYDNINKPFIEREKAQMAGYTSKQNMNNHKDNYEGNAYFDRDGQIEKKAIEKAKKNASNRVQATMGGLVGRTLDKKEVEKQHKVVESKKIKKLTFNKTEFLTENHMITKIPDEYKYEGNKFIMKDKKHNEYLVEWVDNKPNVTKKVNLVEFENTKDKLKHLWEYNSREYNSTSTTASRVMENNSFDDILNKARKLMK